MKHSDKDIEAAKACYKEHQWIPATMEEREIRAFLAGLEHKQKDVDELLNWTIRLKGLLEESDNEFNLPELNELIQKHKR